MVRDMISVVMYKRKRVLFIHMPVLNQLETNNIIMIKTLMIIVPVVLGMKKIVLLINNFKNRVWKIYFQINPNLLQEN